MSDIRVGDLIVDTWFTRLTAEKLPIYKVEDVDTDTDSYTVKQIYSKFLNPTKNKSSYAISSRRATLVKEAYLERIAELESEIEGIHKRLEFLKGK